MALTPKETQFVLEYMKDFNIGRAAQVAGISDGAKLMKDPRIAYALSDMQKKVSQAAQVDRAYVVKRLQKIADNAEACGRFGEAVSAWKLIGQSVGAFTEVHEHKGIPGGEGAPIEIVLVKPK